MNHTPLPWHAVESSFRNERIIAENNRVICEMHDSDPIDSRNARHIVHCVNAHERLVKSLIECLTIVRLKCGNLHDDTNQIQKDALDAIEAATGDSK